MFKIIQSHRTEKLVDQLLLEYQSVQQSIFEPFVVIVPSMVLGDWLDKTIASRAGISTLVMTKFWGQYQWTLMQEVLTRHNEYLLSKNPNEETLNVPEVAVLSPTVMQWRIFGYLTYYLPDIIKDKDHPLNTIVDSLIDQQSDLPIDQQTDKQNKTQANSDGSLNIASNNSRNLNNSDKSNEDKAQSAKSQQDARLWQLASDLARVFNRYLTHREDWLQLWSSNKKLNVEQMIAEKDALSLRFDKYARGTPGWLVEHYIELEEAQRFLWFNLFADVHQYRMSLEKQFWVALKTNSAGEKYQLPKQLRIFTIQQLPQTELDFLQQLSLYMDITLLHYNPSKLFWADIVDKSWLQRQQIINPESVFLRDYGHSLLSRLGKQSRDTFAMLANLSGNDQFKNAVVEWIDDFEDEYGDEFNENDDFQFVDDDNQQDLANEPSLLHRLQNDVLMLDEQGTQQAAAVTVTKAISKQLQGESDNDEPKESETKGAWYDDDVLESKRFVKHREWSFGQDNSLSIHSCHSLQRQLEILRIMIGRWLNEPTKIGEKKRHISDIVVLLPDVERHHALISSIFVSGKGQDGLTLPAKVTGVVDASIRHLWEAIIGFYKLLGSDSARFAATEVLDWLMLPPLHESFGLTHEQMSRGCDLLIEAGFVRGFDELHLQQTLDNQDFDYRFTFAQALDRLTLGLVMPEAEITDCLYPIEENQWPESAIHEMSLPLPQVSLNDAPIIEALCRIFSGLEERRGDYKLKFKAEDWLSQIETNVIHRYFSNVDQTRSMRAIYNAMNGFKSSLRANRHYLQYSTDQGAKSKEVETRLSGVERLPLKLSFMLDSIEDELESQQVSAEPTGVITFGRFGALRNVPFDLVVMLNMNLSEFPNRDRDNRYDLIKATNARRGDRVSEDDDNGAFLDALLCARSACWIFYNGQSLTDTHEHLPANPVSELLQFLQGEVQWRVSSLQSLSEGINSTGIDSTTENLKRYLPRLVKQWLVTEHPALPFHNSLFQVQVEQEEKFNNQQTDNATQSDIMDDIEIDELDTVLQQAMFQTKLQQKKQFPPAPLWQAVFETLNNRHSITVSQRVTLPTDKEYKAIAKLFGEKFGQLGVLDNQLIATLMAMLNVNNEQSLSQSLFDIEEIDIEADLAYKVRHPANTYLRNQKVYVLQGEESIASQEPLFLDHLSAYKIKENLIQNLKTMQAEVGNADSDIAQQQALNQKALQYQNIMPAGVARKTTLSNEIHNLELQCQLFKQQLISYCSDQAIELEGLNLNLKESSSTLEFLSLLSPTSEYPVRIASKTVISQLIVQDNDPHIYIENWLQLLPNVIKIKGLVPLQAKQGQTNLTSGLSYNEQSPKQWLNILPNSASPRHLLKFWLSHLYWQVARQTTAEQVVLNDGMSIWHFNKSSAKLEAYKQYTTFKLNPISYEQAVAELIKWAIFGKLSEVMPLTLLPEYALLYLQKWHQAEEKEQGTYWPKRSDFSEWLSPNYGNDVIFDTCSQHAIWQYLLCDQDVFKALSMSLTTLSKPLYDSIFSNLEGLA
ncbi:exodeoxyribonuclease V subunit gamma [Psychrobacter sp.]|uniref:exodeoxyribonuclease V subunit gamma n=1 Tax=Psychrobacter sp. TaxID=56811 RepID=UPI0025E0FE6D|nr:exodeoxyribonuclease V subunit gamma [Psychrobacter sp.]